MTQIRQSETTWRESRDKWAKIWFEKLSRFHGRKPQATWEFTADEVILFLRDHVRRKTPAWKRLKIIQSLMCYRRYIQAAPLDDLKFIQTKLEELARAEKVSGSAVIKPVWDMVRLAKESYFANESARARSQSSAQNSFWQPSISSPGWA